MKLKSILSEIILKEYNKSIQDAIASKLGLKRDLELEKVLNKLNSQGIKYSELKNKLGNEIKTLDDLKSLLTVSKNDIKISKKSNSTVILDNENFFIVRPESKESSIYYGSGTKWCTAAKNDNYFNRYIGKGITLYYIIDKTKDSDDNLYKVAIAIKPSGKMEAFNARDRSIDPKTYLDDNKLPLSLFKSIKIEIPISIEDFVESTYTKNSDGSYDVIGDVDLGHQNLTKLPFKFNKVSGDFYCNYNKLTTLKGAPTEVGGGFYCTGNKKQFTEDDVRKVSNVRSNIYC